VNQGKRALVVDFRPRPSRDSTQKVLSKFQLLRTGRGAHPHHIPARIASFGRSFGRIVGYSSVTIMATPTANVNPIVTEGWAVILPEPPTCRTRGSIEAIRVNCGRIRSNSAVVLLNRALAGSALILASSFFGEYLCSEARIEAAHRYPKDR